MALPPKDKDQIERKRALLHTLRERSEAEDFWAEGHGRYRDGQLPRQPYDWPTHWDCVREVVTFVSADSEQIMGLHEGVHDRWAAARLLTLAALIFWCVGLVPIVVAGIHPKTSTLKLIGTGLFMMVVFGMPLGYIGIAGFTGWRRQAIWRPQSPKGDRTTTALTTGLVLAMLFSGVVAVFMPETWPRWPYYDLILVQGWALAAVLCWLGSRIAVTRGPRAGTQYILARLTVIVSLCWLTGLAWAIYSQTAYHLIWVHCLAALAMVVICMGQAANLALLPITTALDGAERRHPCRLPTVPEAKVIVGDASDV